MAKVYSYDEAWTALCIWEDLLERHRSDPDADTPLDRYWDNVGTSQMRDDTIRVLAPWVDMVWEELRKQLGDDAHGALGMDAYDWEFVPACIYLAEFEEGDSPYPQGWKLPEPERVAALLIAEHVLLDGMEQ